MHRLMGILLASGLLGIAPARADETIKIGLMAPLTGSWASEGQEMKLSLIHI